LSQREFLQRSNHFLGLAVEELEYLVDQCFITEGLTSQSVEVDRRRAAKRAGFWRARRVFGRDICRLQIVLARHLRLSAASTIEVAAKTAKEQLRSAA